MRTVSDENEDRMRTPKLLSSVLEDEDTRMRIQCMSWRLEVPKFVKMFDGF